MTSFKRLGCNCTRSSLYSVIHVDSAIRSKSFLVLFTSSYMKQSIMHLLIRIHSPLIKSHHMENSMIQSFDGIAIMFSRHLLNISTAP